MGGKKTGGKKGKKIKMSEEEDNEKLKELIGLIFNLYCECDHTGWESPHFKNKQLGEEIKREINELEYVLWGTFLNLEKTLKAEEKRG